jgi:hypothetical protein
MPSRRDFPNIYTAYWQFGCGPCTPPTPDSATISPASTNGTRHGEFIVLTRVIRRFMC